MRLDNYKIAQDLIDYLIRHEDDIAWGINDFGELKDLFSDVILWSA